MFDEQEISFGGFILINIDLLAFSDDSAHSLLSKWYAQTQLYNFKIMLFFIK